MLRLYNSLSRKKEEFIPIIDGKINLYTCGPTVYDVAHIGNFRTFLFEDFLKRVLIARGFDVYHVMNITDVDDKTIQKALAEGKSLSDITEYYTNLFMKDLSILKIIPADVYPAATEHVDGMIQMIQQLIEKNHAYLAQDGSVYFSIKSFKDYGSLTNIKMSEMQHSDRVSSDEYSLDNPQDFALWKAYKDEDGDVCWESPWGKGRPGWHIECSAMCENYLGEHFDIHGGGQDLQFPHHENEIAQSEAAHDTPFVNYWMHNGFVRVDNEKMSKSLGNFFTVREILANYQPEVVRFFILRAHYRSPLNYSDSHLEDAKHALDRLYTALKGNIVTNKPKLDWNNIHAQRFMGAMNDDFNTPEAIAVLFDLANETNKKSLKQGADLLKGLGGILGLLQQDPQQYFQDDASLGDSAYTSEQIEDLIQERVTARKEGDYARADEIRKDLFNAGVVLEDNPQGTGWRRG